MSTIKGKGVCGCDCCETHMPNDVKKLKKLIENMYETLVFAKDRLDYINEIRPTIATKVTSNRIKTTLQQHAELKKLYED